jgi:para-nitrobenzyl esterase
LNATNFGGACPQEHRFNLTEESLTENCLTLNISTPKDISAGEKLPVMIWIPGGGFVGGSSNLYRLDKLAREGRIIVVSLNYRVGALGFMPHPSITEGWNGNLGLEDQRLAMRWVKDNIGAFNGDNTKITIAGESAGSASTCLHLLRKSKTEGLFQQAIALSYNCLYKWSTLEEAKLGVGFSTDGAPTPVWARMSALLGCNQNPGSAEELNCMRGKDIKELLKAQGTIAEIVPIFPFAPLIDSGLNGTIPIKDLNDVAEIDKNLNKLAMLYGGAKDELSLYVAYDVLKKMEGNPSFNPNLLRTSDQFVIGQFTKYYAFAGLTN